MFSVRYSPLLGLCVALIAGSVASDHVSGGARQTAARTAPMAGAHLPTSHTPKQFSTGPRAGFVPVGNSGKVGQEPSRSGNFFSAPPVGFQRLQLATADDMDLFRSRDVAGDRGRGSAGANGSSGAESQTYGGGSAGSSGGSGGGSGGSGPSSGDSVGSDLGVADPLTPDTRHKADDVKPVFIETELVLDLPRIDSPRGSMDDPLSVGSSSPGIGPSGEGSFGPKPGPMLSGAVPEPVSWALMILGFGLIGATLRGQKRAQPLI